MQHLIKKVLRHNFVSESILGYNKNGNGLGLMICKKLISMLGPSSEINVES